MLSYYNKLNISKLTTGDSCMIYRPKHKLVLEPINVLLQETNKKLDNDEYMLASVHYSLGCLYVDTERYDEAEVVHTKALEYRQQ